MTANTGRLIDTSAIFTGALIPAERVAAPGRPSLAPFPLEGAGASATGAFAPAGAKLISASMPGLSEPSALSMSATISIVRVRAIERGIDAGDGDLEPLTDRRKAYFDLRAGREPAQRALGQSGPELETAHVLHDQHDRRGHHRDGFTDALQARGHDSIDRRFDDRVAHRLLGRGDRRARLFDAGSSAVVARLGLIERGLGNRAATEQLLGALQIEIGRRERDFSRRKLSARLPGP